LKIRFGVLVLFCAAAFAQESGFRFEREIRPGGPGPNRLDIDVALLAGSRSEQLPDLRVHDAANREVPYLLVAPRPSEPRWKSARVLPVRATKTTSGFEADLGSSILVDRLRIQGLGTPMLKRFRLEGSGDRARWTLLVPDGTIFDLPEERLVRTEVDFPTGEYRYVRVTWDDRQSARVPLPRSVAARLVERTGTASPVSARAVFERRASEPGKSRFRIRLPGSHLPVRALRLQVTGGHVLREAVVTEGRLEGGEVKPHEIGRATLRRAEQGDAAAEEMNIEIQRPSGPDLELEVDDGSNPPLPLSAVFAELSPLPWIYFESADGQPLVARYGNAALDSPRYDVEAMRRYIDEVSPRRAEWSRQQDSSATSPKPAKQQLALHGAIIDTRDFAYAREIPFEEPGLTSLLVDGSVLAHSREDLGDIRIVDDKSRQIPYLLERRREPLRINLTYPKRKPDSSRVSTYQILLPYQSLPNEARLVLETESRVFERRVQIVEPAKGGARDEERILAETTWRHADPETSPPSLDLPIQVKGVSTLEVRIDEGDNAPISLRPAALLFPAYRVRFFYPEGAGLKLVYGNPNIQPPKYDLALLSARLFGAPAQESSARPEESRPVRGDTGSRAFFWSVLVLAAAVLVTLLARLLRAPATGTP
jgi:hypothetical protein